MTTEAVDVEALKARRVDAEQCRVAGNDFQLSPEEFLALLDRAEECERLRRALAVFEDVRRYLDEVPDTIPEAREWQELAAIEEPTAEQIERMGELARYITWRADGEVQFERADRLRREREVLARIICQAMSTAGGRWVEWGERAVLVERVLDEGLALCQGKPAYTTTLHQLPDTNAWECQAADCGETWELMDGTPSENRMRYCNGCGRRVVAKKPWEWEPAAGEEGEE